MRRTVIQIRNEQPDKDRASLQVAAAQHHGLTEGADIDYPEVFPEDQAGDWLSKLFAGIAAIMADLAYQPIAGEGPAPVYIADWTPKSQAMPWESISLGGNFLALDGQRPVGRMLGGVTEVGAEVQRILTEPLRLLVVISAIGVRGVDEWNEIYQGLMATGLPFSIWAIVAEPELVDLLKNLNDARVEHELLHSEGGEVVSRFDEMIRSRIIHYRPNVLHFFCHGRVTTSRPLLELATRRDHIMYVPPDAAAGNPARGSVILGEEFFEALRGGANKNWLVVLNCCNGAVPKNGAPLAKKVAEKGFPAVIGMRAEISAKTAATFSGEFYRTFGAALKSRIPATGDEWRVDWATLLTLPRQRICKELGGSLAYADKIKDWTHPVLYVRRESFVLVKGESSEELLGKLQQLTNYREEATRTGATIPPDVLGPIDKEIHRIKDQLGLIV
jgi:hypothetical protein